MCIVFSKQTPIDSSRLDIDFVKLVTILPMSVSGEKGGSTVEKRFQCFMSWLIIIAVFLSLFISTVAIAAEESQSSSTKTELISSSTQACEDSWTWTGTGDKIATLPYGEIHADQIFVAAVCSPYWTDYRYSADPTQTEVSFTAGEGLVTIALRVRKESGVWGGSECVYAEITPTTAASRLAIEKTVSGTFKMFYAAWGQYCNVPFEITLKPGSSQNDSPTVEPADPGPNTGVMRAAMAVVDITPARDVYLQGYDGATDASLAKYPSNFKSNLNARILILDNRSDRLVFLNLELVFSGVQYGTQNLSPQALQQIAQICHTSTSNILLSNTHNHQSNMILAQREEQHILQGVAQAYSRLAPVKIGTTTVNTQFGISRGGDYTMDANAPYDSLMTIVRFDNAETGIPMGLIYSVPMHNTMYSNGPGLSANIKNLNCEFTGYASREIEAQMAQQNPYFTAMHINGFYGNAGPYANGKWYASSLEELKANGASFAQEILSGFHAIQTQTIASTLQSDFAIDSIPANQSDQAYRQQFGDLDEMPLYITLGAFSDIAYVGVNYEPFSVIGAKLKAESPYRTLLPAGDVNGWKGYIPTEEAFALHQSGNYQAECVWNKTPFDARAEDIFYDKVFAAVCDMAGTAPVRVPLEYSGVTANSSVAEYTFQLENAAALDKLVISFGQDSRTDCAMDFDLLVYGMADQLIMHKTYSGNTTNYLGEFLDGAKAVKAVLKVRSRYGSGTNGIAQLQPQVWGIRYCTLPPYTETVSDSIDYAIYGDGQWNITPKPLELTIGTREKYTLALATSYWALPEVSGYSSTPTQLNATFTSGDGLLEFQVKLAPGPIWDGAECELLTITPTNAAYLLEQTTTVTGHIDIYWRGFTKMPFSITILAPDGQCSHPSYEKFCCTDCGYFDEAAFLLAADLNCDGKISAFDAQILAEANAGLRQLTDDRLNALYDLTPADIIDYILGRHPIEKE